MATTYELDGFIFESREEYNKAKKESEAISYIRSNTDFENMTLVKKMYDKLIDKGTFHTVVGYAFLKEIQDKLNQGEESSKAKVKSIPVKKTEHQVKVKETPLLSDEAKQAEYYKNLYQKEKTKKTSTKIIIGFLVVIIVAMFLVAQLTPYTVFSNYEDKIVNKYEEWQQQLEEKEAELNQREAQLQEKE